MSCLNSSASALAVKALGAATPVKRQAPVRGVIPLVLGLMSLAAASHSIAEPLPAPLVFKTLDFGTDPTFLTGIRGNNIVGNYVIPGTTETGGLLYNLSSGVFSAFPVPTANGANYPGAIGSSPYGPSFGSQLGVLNAVGSYKVSSSPYDLSYLYSGASGPGANLTPLAYPGTSTLDTIAHSTFGNQVVGNYDTRLAAGNAFVYSINTGTYQTNNFPGAFSTTAYGVWGDKIAGGYFPPGLGFERGYIYDESTGVWTTYNHPGAVFTHFEGITGAGRSGEYNLVADWAGLNGVLHAAVLHIGAGGTQTWIDYAVPGASVTSANSIYENEAIGVYVDANGLTNGYLTSIPGIYNPIRNLGLLSANTPNSTALNGGSGDDLVNQGTILVSGPGSVGIRGGDFGVLTNSGLIQVSGPGSVGVQLDGRYGTLLNSGSISAGPGAYALQTGPMATGPLIVNDGVIDGPVSVTPPGADARFENSGWLGVSSPGPGVTHLILGDFVQTSGGTLALRVAPGQSDLLAVSGHATLTGTLALISASGVPPKIADPLTLVYAGGGLSGKFTTVLNPYSPVITLDLVYGPNALNLEFGTDFTSFALTPNQRAAAHLLDFAALTPKTAPLSSFLFQEPAANIPGDLQQISPDGLSSLYEISFSNANIQRLILEGRLDELHSGLTGFSSNMNLNGASVNLEAQGDGKSSKNTIGPVLAPTPENRWGVWVTGFGDFVNVDSDANARGYDFTTGGVSLGVDYRIIKELAIGLVGEYAHSWTSLSPSGNIDVNSGRGGIYATYFTHGFYLNGAAYGGGSNYSSSRSGLGELASGNTAGAEFSIFATGGYDWHLSALSFGPIAALQYTYVNFSKFSENGSLAALQFPSQSADSLRTDIGFRVSYLWQIGKISVEPLLKAAWEHEYLYSALPIAAGFAGFSGPIVTFNGPSEGHDSAIVSAGTLVHWTPAIATYVNYDGQLGRSLYESNAVTGGMLFSF
jgi:subtilase-type serine protease